MDDVLKGGTAGGFDGCLQGEGLGVRCLGCCCGSWFITVLLAVVGLTMLLSSSQLLDSCPFGPPVSCIMKY